MKSRLAEIVLISLTVLLLLWRIVQNASTGVGGQVFWTMIALAMLLATISNLFIRSRGLATGILFSSGIVISLIAFGAWRSRTAETQPAVSVIRIVRGLSFYMLLLVTGVLQQHSTQATHQRDGKPRPIDWTLMTMLGTSLLVFAFAIVTQRWWFLWLNWPVLLFSRSLFRTMGWSDSNGLTDRAKFNQMQHQSDRMERLASPRRSNPKS